MQREMGKLKPDSIIRGFEFEGLNKFLNPKSKSVLSSTRFAELPLPALIKDV